jgi:hypothetical protein
MPSTLKSETARANGAKSHGPVTPEGKAKSSQNAVRHGLTANFNVLPGESQDDFQILLDAYIDRFNPSDPVETELVQTMAITRWRLRRIGNLESGLLEDELSRAPGSTAVAFRNLANQGNALSLLIRYEASLNRLHDRALKQLELLQDSYVPNEPIQLVYREPVLTSRNPFPPARPPIVITGGQVQQPPSRSAPEQPPNTGPCNERVAIGYL